MKKPEDFITSEPSVPEVGIEGTQVEETAATSDGKSILIMTAVIIGLFALTFAGFSAYNHFTAAQVLDVDELHTENLQGELAEEEGYLYNGFSVVQVDGLWWTERMIRGKLYKIPLHFGPKEVENIPVNGGLHADFNKGETIYMAIDPAVADKYYTLALSELSFNIAKAVNRIPEGSCTTEDVACVNRTIISCENTGGKPVIQLEIGGEPMVEYTGTCIKVRGTEYGLVKAADRLLYDWYGIIK